MENNQLIRATRPFAKEDRRLSWFHTLTTLCFMGLAYSFIFYSSFWIVKITASILLGLLLVRMFIIYHDYLHRAILQRSLVAKIIFTIYGYFILAAPSVWKRSHNYHHKHNSKLYTSSIGSFPVVTKEKFLSASKTEQRIYLFIRHPFTLVFGYLFTFIYGMSILSLVRNPAKHWDSGVSLVFHVVLGFLIFNAFGWSGLILGFFLPYLIGHALGSYLFYAQHNFPSVTFREKDGWTYISAAMESSSYMKMSPIMHWFTGNIGYHHIHHINEAIPFYRLPAAYAGIPELQQAKTTSLQPAEIWRCLQLKVWEPVTKRMIGLKEMGQ
ncbi:MAG: fatty acid desaturase [Saprospiraceae bacterium]